MSYYIFGEINDRVVTLVGCTKSLDLPPNSILLQEVEDHPEANWVKWSIRFRRTLKDRKPLDHPYAKYFRNPWRLERLLGKEEFDDLAGRENAEFLRYNEKNPTLLKRFLDAALARRAEGRHAFSAGELIGEARWGETEPDRGTDRFKINDRWVPWYSRLAQMLEPDLVGFFEIRDSIADGLVWTDGRTWQQFASENSERVRWSDPFDEFPDSDWVYMDHESVFLTSSKGR